tara:strand:- start:3251 stop:3514 length:264 start_codon:yes stop_codon:yes gene_type:complete
MKIDINNKTYLAGRDSNGWTLGSPTEGVSPKTGETVQGHKETYHATAGQVLAAIADREMGDAADLDELRAMVDTLRADLLAVSFTGV